MKRIGLFILLSGILAASSFAAPSIPEVNLLKGSVLSKIPVYNQGATGLCYAFTASQLLDYYRISTGTPMPSQDSLTSPLWMAALSTSKESRSNPDSWSPLDYGSAKDTLEWAMEAGTCIESEMKKAAQPLVDRLEQLTGAEFEPLSAMRLGQILLIEFQAELANAKKEINGQTVSLAGFNFQSTYAFKRPPATPRTPAARYTTEPVSPGQPPASGPSTKSFTPTTPLPPSMLNILKPEILMPDNTMVSNANCVAKVEQYTKEKIAKRAYERLQTRLTNAVQANSNALPKNTRALIQWTDEILDHPDDFFGRIQRSALQCKLQKTFNIPVWEFNRSIFTRESSIDRNFIATAKQAIQGSLTNIIPQPVAVSFCGDLLKNAGYAFSKNCDWHAISIIGQRMQNSKLQYLLQNTWGPRCDGRNYAPEWECLEGQGALWVDGELLLRQSRQVIGLATANSLRNNY